MNIFAILDPSIGDIADKPVRTETFAVVFQFNKTASREWNVIRCKS